MKYIAFIVLILLLCSCRGTAKSQDNARYIESEVELDLIPLTAYEYKRRGNGKLGLEAIEDYKRALIVNSQYDSVYILKSN